MKKALAVLLLVSLAVGNMHGPRRFLEQGNGLRRRNGPGMRRMLPDFPIYGSEHGSLDHFHPSPGEVTHKEVNPQEMEMMIPMFLFEPMLMG
jgi:hypothetical protein